MKLKKFLALLLALLLAASLVACGSIEDDDDSKEDSDITATETNEDDGDEGDRNDKTGDEDEKAVKDEPGTVIFEEKDITVTYEGYSEGEFLGPELSFSVKNDSDELINISADYAVVNEYMIYLLFGTEVAAGETESIAMVLDSDDLEISGIETVKDVEFILQIMNEEYEVIAESEMIGLTVTDKEVNQKFDDGGTTVLDKEGIRIVAKTEVNTNGILGPEVYFYVENNTDKDVVVLDSDGVLVNGLSVSSILISDVYAGKKCVTDITVYEEEMAENGITDISEVSFKISVFEADSYKNILPEEQITVKY